MAKTPQLVDHLGRPVQSARLREEIAGPTVGGVRSPIGGHPAQGLTPQRLASILRTAEEGDPTAYFELAEEMEEKDLHYLGVLGTRKRQVTQLEITVEAADDDPDSQADAQLLRDWLDRDTLEDDLFDVMDAVGKAISVTEIIWEMSERQWWPSRLEWVDPRFLKFDPLGREILLRDAAGQGTPLDPFKYVVHRVRAKSGLAIRGGLARPVAWAWMFKNYTVKDWVAFAEVYGMPLRLGRYENGATERDKAILLRAVTDISSDAAAIVPKSMDIEFVDGKQSNSDGALFMNMADWFDRQTSKAVLGQTGTTDMQAGGGFAQSKTLDGVRSDIEKADARGLAMTLNRDLGRPMVDLNRGKPKSGKYPRFVIGRTEAWDVEKMMPAVKEFVSLGGRVGMSTIRDRLGIPDVAAGEEVLTLAAPAQIPPQGPGDQSPAPLLPKNPLSPSQGLLNPLKALAGGKAAASVAPVAAPPADAVDRFIDGVQDDWVPMIDDLIGSVETVLAGCASIEDAKARIASALGDMDVTAFTELLARGSFSARLAGITGLDLDAGEA